MHAVPGLEGAVAVVTGGASGIGLACRELLEASGAQVHVADLAGAPPVDVSDRAAREELAGRIGPRLDVLVNAAGILVPNRPLAEITEEDARRSLEVNALGTLFACQAFEPLLRASRGAIVNVTASGSILAAPNQAAYTASKGAVDALTRSLAVDLSPDVRVNAVSPGLTVTPMTRWAVEDEAFVARVSSRTPIGRLLQPQEIAAAIVFLASPLASGITGALLRVDGGVTAGLSSMAR
jgi:3-oxoacyl-[acyl-carrier protein] reductase